jgi:hypothetical protein
MSSSDKYKNQIMNDLASGNIESLNNDSSVNSDNYENFDDFAQRSTREQRHGLFRRGFHHDNIPPQQMEPELQNAIAQIQPNERDDVARDFLKHLQQRGLNDRDLERQLSLSTHHPNRMSADDVSKLANFVYHSHPDIFQEVMAERPALLKFISNPLVAAALGVVAAKWLRKR